MCASVCVTCKVKEGYVESEHRRTHSFLPEIISLFIMCVGTVPVSPGKLLLIIMLKYVYYC